jgi:hypothetical protein
VGLVARYPHNILLGDFNIDLLSGSQRSNDFVSDLEGIAMTEVSKEPTHFQVTMPSLIDLFITGEPCFSQLSLPGMNAGHNLGYRYYRLLRCERGRTHTKSAAVQELQEY